MRRYLAIVLAAVLVFGSIPADVVYADETEYTEISEDAGEPKGTTTTDADASEIGADVSVSDEENPDEPIEPNTVTESPEIGSEETDPVAEADTPEEYEPTAADIEASDVNFNGSEGHKSDVDTAGGEEETSIDPNTITAIDSPSETEFVMEFKPALERLLDELPQTITVHRGDKIETIDANWVCDGEYDEYMGEYPFIPDMEGYILADDVELPRIIVTFENETGGEVGELSDDVPGFDAPVMSYGRRRASNEALPSKYNLFDDGKLPLVKRQSPYETCWTFATIGSIEMDLITDGVISDPDLSELHLAYYASHDYNDPKGCYSFSVNPNKSGGCSWINNGGSVRAASKLLSNLVGVVSEDEVPYSAGDAFSPDDSYIVSKDCVRVKNAYYINPSDTDSIKRAIIEHGGVAAAYKETASSNEYSSTKNSYYCSTTGHNHAVMFVGWNDGFPKEDFASTPPGNGAWLVRNSWGDNGYGHSGYFWLSYYDAGFRSTKEVVAFDAVADTFDHCYAYDGSIIGDVGNTVDDSQQVKETYNVSAGEVIRGVGFEINTPNVTADVSVKNKSTGDTVSTSVKTSFAGIYTAEFDNALEIASDAEVEVSITYKADSGEGVLILGEPTQTVSFGDYDYTGIKDKGFMIGNGRYNYDPRMKLYTDDIGSGSGDTGDHSVTGVSVSRSSASIGIGETITLTSTVYPLSATDRTVTWSTSDDSIATVDNGVVTGVSKGTAVITVTTNDGGKTATCTVNVKSIPVQGVYISAYYAELYPGYPVTYEAVVYPENATDKSVTWSSSNPEIATVTNEGVVTAVKPGTTDITVTTNDGRKSDSCTLTVLSVPLYAIYISPSQKTIMVGQTFTITVSFSPSDASDRSVVWSSNNPEVASVSDEGVVTGLKPGTAIITVTSNDGGYSKSCSVTVNPVTVTNVQIEPSTDEILVGSETTLMATVLPENATDKSITWTSSNTSVATVTSTGVVKGLKPGTVTIRATANNGKYATCSVTVKPVPVESVEIDPTTAEIMTGDTIFLNKTVIPENAGNKSVTWTSSDPTVATVSNTGIVTGVAPGDAIITVTTNDGGKKATCSVTVKPIPVSGVTVLPENADVYIGGTVSLTASVAPSNAANKSVTWNSNNMAVATVSDAGVVTGVAAGTVQITATTGDGGFSDSCTVTVKPVPVTGVEISPESVEITVDEETTLASRIIPANATDQSVVWSSDNSGTATVTQNGVVKGINPGTTNITVTSNDGSKSAKCKVTVKPKPIPVSGVTVSPKSADIVVNETISLTAAVSPEDATNKSVTWKSSNPDVASITAAGVVKGIKPGNATITVTTSDGGKTDTCIVTIKPIPVSGVTVSPENADIYINGTVSLTATVSPGDAANKSVTWISNNTAVATVSDTGVVTGVSEGTAVITVTTNDGGKTDTSTVSVKAVTVTGVEILPASMEITVDEETTLASRIIPANATDCSVVWKSDDQSIATVTQNGVVKGIKPGTTNITVTTNDGGKSARCKVTVKPKPIPVSTVTVSPKSTDIFVNETTYLEADILPEDATNKAIVWKSSNPEIASVTAAGVVKGIKPGTATITVTTSDGGKTDTCTVTVKAVKVTGLVLDRTSASISIGNTLTLSPRISPADATDKRVTWTSSNADVATVSSTGVVKGIAAGTATITCTTTDGSSRSATCTVTVTPVKVSAINLNKTSASVVKGATITLSPSISPANATNRAVTWKSSNKKIATVTKDGVVKGVAKGTVTITCTAKDGSGKKATCKITVKNPVKVKSVKLNKSKVTVKKKKTVQLKATISPKNATNKDVTWKSSNKKIATVDKNGVVKGIKKGTATITVTTKDGKKTAKCKVTVK